jgi:hypothetical protein
VEADIAGVERQLECARESFVVRGFDGSGTDELQKATRLLEEIYRRAQQEAPASSLATAMQDLKMQTVLLGQLVDSAAAFYRGWFGAAPLAEGYTAEGVWTASQGSVPVCGLSLEA